MQRIINDNREIPAVLPGLFRVAFVLHFGVKHDIFMPDFKFCFYLIFHKPSKYKDSKEKCDFTIFLKECRQWDLNPHVVAHNRF